MSVLERYGDTFIVVWQEHNFGFTVDHLKDTQYGLRGEVKLESIEPKRRSYGPINLNLQSDREIYSLARSLSQRVNSFTEDEWHGAVVEAFARVCNEWRKPEPSIIMSEYAGGRGITYLLPLLVPENETTIMYADGESGKSLVAILIGICVQYGLPLPWGIEPAPRNVMYLDWETNPETFYSRVARVCDGLQLDLPGMVYRRVERNLADEAVNIKEEIDKREIGLVIVDSIGFAASGSLNEDDVARSTMNTLRSFSPATRLVVAHVSKNEAEKTRGKAKPFGSAFFWNGMRSGIELRKVNDLVADDMIELAVFHQKTNDGRHARPVGLCIEFQGAEGPITFRKTSIEDIPELHDRLTISARIIECLKRGQMNTVEIAESLDESPDTVNRTLKRMANKSVVQIYPPGGRGNPGVWGLKAL
jgi:hypothetical protein